MTNTNDTLSNVQQIREFINIKLVALGCPIFGEEEDYPYLQLSKSLLANYRAKDQSLLNFLCPADQRIQDFLNSYLGEFFLEQQLKLPSRTFVLDRPGLARALSLSPDSDHFESDMVNSYRVKQGVLHNPVNDRRTTKGVFHVTEGGLPIGADKVAVPKHTFARLFAVALNPPKELLYLPFLSTQKSQAELFVSLLLRPIVCPKVSEFSTEKSMEIRFFAPASLVSNLDFVETIFGNAGDPYLAINDAGLDVDQWTGHTGCVILAPHLTHLTKKELGLPHFDEASDRQKRDGVYWQDPGELYNNGNAFKITARDERGTIITLIADNYFGYCKKEVKTQISYAANLYGLCEEEHAGGALAFPSYDLGEDFQLSNYISEVDHSLEQNKHNYPDLFDLQPEGFGIDKKYSDIVYLPESSRITLHNLNILWKTSTGNQSIKLSPDVTYVLPSGYKVEMLKPGEGRRWRLVGTRAEGTLCHKPCTVSGGGKSEISKSISDAIINGPIFVHDFQKDFDLVEQILYREYGERFQNTEKCKTKGRPLLSTERSLGSVVKLLTPGFDYSDEYNQWLRCIPNHIKELVLLVKRFYNHDWEKDWRQRFNVDVINGKPGYELKYRSTKLLTSYLRVGYAEDGSWRIFGLRKDFNPAEKIQFEDDITASITFPAASLKFLNSDYKNASVKFVKNCEYRLFQRPDDAVNRGYDKQTELELSEPDNFISNFQPLTRSEAKEMVEDAIRFDYFTEPMGKLIRDFTESDDRPHYIVSSANPRLVNGTPSKNPRYLQNRSDLLNPRKRYLAKLGIRLYRRVPKNEPVLFPVNAVLPGRRNNPPEPGIRSLAVNNPIHYMELPELFMEYIASITGKSPSTTGAGSEGALTKGPFNSLLPIHDLNNALVSYIITGYDCFLTAAGYVGPRYRMAHDISLLVPEIWCRMKVEERNPEFLIKNSYLEKCNDIEYGGKKLLMSRLGYRITERFAKTFFGRVFSDPGAIFTDEMLRPEKQDMDIFSDGMDNIVSTHQRIAKLYFDDDSISFACPPLKVLLHIMLENHYNGKDLNAPEIRYLFTREYLLKSDWYAERLSHRQSVAVNLWERHINYIVKYLSDPGNEINKETLNLEQRLKYSHDMLTQVKSPEYLDSIMGTIGADPFLANNSPVRV